MHRKGDRVKTVKRKITKEEFDQAKKEGAYSLISETIIMGYGAYGAKVEEEEGEYFLEFEMGDSCD